MPEGSDKSALLGEVRKLRLAPRFGSSSLQMPKEVAHNQSLTQTSKTSCLKLFPVVNTLQCLLSAGLLLVSEQLKLDLLNMDGQALTLVTLKRWRREPSRFDWPGQFSVALLVVRHGSSL